MRDRICKACGLKIKEGAVRNDGYLFHYECVEDYYGIKVWK